jgi:hypothetical protein
MTDPEDPAHAASASVTQAVAVAATAAELLASSAARRAHDRADTADRHTAALRSQAHAETAAGRLAFDACGDPMPSATAVLASHPEPAGGQPATAGHIIDGHVVGRAYPVPQTAQSAAAQRPSTGSASSTAGLPAQAAEAARALAAPPRPPTVR